MTKYNNHLVQHYQKMFRLIHFDFRNEFSGIHICGVKVNKILTRIDFRVNITCVPLISIRLFELHYTVINNYLDVITSRVYNSMYINDVVLCEITSESCLLPALIVKYYSYGRHTNYDILIPYLQQIYEKYEITPNPVDKLSFTDIMLYIYALKDIAEHICINKTDNDIVESICHYMLGYVNCRGIVPFVSRVETINMGKFRRHLFNLKNGVNTERAYNYMQQLLQTKYGFVNNHLTRLIVDKLVPLWFIHDNKVMNLL
jgi:hypothetical protein